MAGVFGASILSKFIGEPNVIAFDVGGTTAKCSLIDDGEVKVTTSYYIEKDERNAGYPHHGPSGGHCGDRQRRRLHRLD